MVHSYIPFVKAKKKKSKYLQFCILLFSIVLFSQMCPIIGDRYQCKDCTEKCGYDLCGDCYTSGSNLPGRFSQKHTPTHRFELVKPVINRNVIYRLLSRQLAVVSSIASRNQSTPVNGDLPSFEEDGVIVDSNEASSASVEDQSENRNRN